MAYLQAIPIDLASDTWKLMWVEEGGVLHCKMACGYGFWKVCMSALMLCNQLDLVLPYRNHQTWCPKSLTRP